MDWWAVQVSDGPTEAGKCLHVLKRPLLVGLALPKGNPSCPAQHPQLPGGVTSVALCDAEATCLS